MADAPANSTPNSPWLEKFRYVPGVSGNPSGRPKGGAQFAKRLLELTNDGKDIAEALVELCMAGKGEVRITAIKEFNNRVYGPAAEVLDEAASGPKGVRIVGA